MDTIFALATAQGKSGVAVIRVSGPQAFEAADKLAGRVPPRRVASLCTLRDGLGDVIDEALVLTFDARASFTGEPVVEFQTHGGIATIAALVSELGKLSGFRQAFAGEFTKRALENGRLDLSQVEGLADLIDAETEAQRVQANRVFSGELGKIATDLRTDLIRAAALLEATIDFADEDVPVDVTPEVVDLLSGANTAIDRQLKGANAAERVRSGYEVAILGSPNAGKSTLLNALAGRDAAITSDIAGTTRDIVEVRMDLGGLPVTLLDTAGLRETDDLVEGLGIAKAKERATNCDLRVFLDTDENTFEDIKRPGDLVVIAKVDLSDSAGFGVSGVTGQGIPELISEITNILSGRAMTAGLAIRERHVEAFSTSKQSVETSIRLLALGPDHYDIVAEELRTAVRALESVVGLVDVENLLDVIFSSFCVGK